MNTINVIIPKRMKGLRLDFALAEMLPSFSRSKVTSWIKSKDALISSQSSKAKDKEKQSIMNLKHKYMLRTEDNGIGRMFSSLKGATKNGS